MNVFNLRDELVGKYSNYGKSSMNINDEAIQAHVAQRLDEGMLWPEPLIQSSSLFQVGLCVGSFGKRMT